MKLDRLNRKYVIIVLLVIFITIGIFYGEKIIVEFKMVTGRAVSISDFNLAHSNSCGDQFWDEGNTRSVYGYVEWINTGSKGFVLLEDKNRSLPKFGIAVEGDKNGEIFKKLLSIKREQEEFSSQKINVSGVVTGFDMQVGGIKGFSGGCSRGAYLIINNPNQISY